MMTKELVKLSQAMRLPMLDHIVIGCRDHFSFADTGLIEEYRKAAK